MRTNRANNMTKKTLATLEKITGGKLTFAKLIWAIRKCEELSQVEFAVKLGISKAHLCDIEHNRKGVSPHLAAIYAKKLNHSASLFVKLALQNIIDREGLPFIVALTPRLKHKIAKTQHVFRANKHPAGNRRIYSASG